MTEYLISFKNPNNHIIDIEVFFSDLNQDHFIINIPSWRPGRYELANYARNILKLEATTSEGINLECVKISKDEWQITTKNKNTLKIKYSYYAFTMDAGNSWLDDQQLYINPINCLFYNKERIRDKCLLRLEIPASYKIATALKEIERCYFISKDYYELADSPIIASANLTRMEYLAGDVEFNIWINGSPIISKEKILDDFLRMSKYQIEMMGEFPEKEYHFLFQILNYPFRHGVEHRNSTVITMGPANQLMGYLYNDFIGIASHELFHAWNVLRIRPKEIMPYDFSRENYFKTGFIAEGITTYYGDLLLVRAGVYSVNQYLHEFTDLLQKHFDNIGNYNMSVADSSFDLWLDGYVQGVPGRKVSIYIKGAVTAFILDIQLRKYTDNSKSLDDVMRYMWINFGKRDIGYSENDFEKIISEVGGKDAVLLLNKLVNGTGDLRKDIEEAMEYVGLKLTVNTKVSYLESDFGIKTQTINGRYLIDTIHPDSPAYLVLSKNDEVLAINNVKFEGFLEEAIDELSITYFRGNRLSSETIKKRNNKTYFNKYSIELKKGNSTEQKENLNSWLNLKS